MTDARAVLNNMSLINRSGGNCKWCWTLGVGGWTLTLNVPFVLVQLDQVSVEREMCSVGLTGDMYSVKTSDDAVMILLDRRGLVCIDGMIKRDLALGCFLAEVDRSRGRDADTGDPGCIETMVRHELYDPNVLGLIAKFMGNGVRRTSE